MIRLSKTHRWRVYSYLHKYRPGRITEMLYVVRDVDRWRIRLGSSFDGPFVGNPDGYRTLRDVREHIAAVEHDRDNGHNVRWA